MKTKIITLAITALVIMSCNNGKKSNSETTKAHSDKTTETTKSTENMAIENTKWVITTLEGKAMSDREQNGQTIYFILNPDGNRVNGYSGCNTFMGTYNLTENNKVSFSHLASTKMMCPDAKINESQILNIFNSSTSYKMNDGKLILINNENENLATFKKAKMDYTIVEKYWKLKTLEGQPITMKDNQEREIYFTLKSGDNRVVGFAGCNAISGEYTLEKGKRIRFKNMATTMKACPDLDFNEAEFLKVFELADNYTIDGDELSLNVGKRAPLAVFEAVYMQ